MLEAACHRSSSFWTLTYSNENLRHSMSGLSSLEPADTQLWLKRIRKAVAPLSLRFYLVGEYGDQTWRPHYHVALFGYPSCTGGRRTECECSVCKLVRDTWGLGHISGGVLETASAQYLCGYVTKKMTKTDDVRLGDRHPEFARMSLRPGIGAHYLHELASVIMEFDLADSEGDVPSSLRHGKRLLPLGRYLRRKLRTYVGMEENAPSHVLETLKAETLQTVFEATGVDASTIWPQLRSTFIKNALIDASHQAVTNHLARAAIFESKKRL